MTEKPAVFAAFASRWHQRLTQLRRRLEQAYVDRLDGKITEEFWEAKSAEWQEEEQALLASLRELEQAENPERALDRVRILELANKAHSLYVTQTPKEKAKLLRMVLSNCAVDAASVYPTYRKPFDMIFERAKIREWWAWVDLNHRPRPYQNCGHWSRPKNLRMAPSFAGVAICFKEPSLKDREPRIQWTLLPWPTGGPRR